MRNFQFSLCLKSTLSSLRPGKGEWKEEDSGCPRWKGKFRGYSRDIPCSNLFKVQWVSWPGATSKFQICELSIPSNSYILNSRIKFPNAFTSGTSNAYRTKLITFTKPTATITLPQNCSSLPEFPNLEELCNIQSISQ